MYLCQTVSMVGSFVHF